MYYIKNKHFIDYSGVESFVRTAMESDDNSWIPILKSEAVPEVDKNGELLARLDRLQNMVDSVDKCIKEKNRKTEGKEEGGSDSPGMGPPERDTISVAGSRATPLIVSKRSIRTGSLCLNK